MAHHYSTKAKTRSDMEGEELEQRDSAPVATTSTASTISVGLDVALTRGSESVSTESAGPESTHPELLPAGGHPSVGGPGVLGSVDPLLVGVSTLGYPSEHTDPTDSVIGGELASASLGSAVEATTTAETTLQQHQTSRQPPTIATEVTAAASRSPTVASSVVDTPTKGRRRSSSAYTLSPPTLSPAYAIEQSQSVPLRRGRAASSQPAASSQRRSQRPPSLSPTQWMGSYDSPSPPIGSDSEVDYPAARPSVYQPRSIEAGQAPSQVGADICQPGSTVDPCVRIPTMFPGVSLLPRFSQIVDMLRLRVRTRDRILRYLQAI